MPSLWCGMDNTNKCKLLSHVRLFVTPWTMQSMEFSRPEYWTTPVSLFWGIFPTQGSNPGFPQCRWILFYQLSHQGSPRIVEWVAYPFSSGFSWLRDWTRVSYIAGRFFTNNTNKAQGDYQQRQVRATAGRKQVKCFNVRFFDCLFSKWIADHSTEFVSKCAVIKKRKGELDKDKLYDPWVWKIPWRREWLSFQYPCLESPVDRGATPVHGVTQSQTRPSD